MTNWETKVKTTLEGRGFEIMGVARFFNEAKQFCIMTYNKRQAEQLKADFIASGAAKEATVNGDETLFGKTYFKVIVTPKFKAA